MAEQRLQLQKKRPLRDEDLSPKYRTTVQEYIAMGHAQRVPDKKLDAKGRTVWYLPTSPCDAPIETWKSQGSF